MKFEKIVPGMVLFDRHKQKMGNTTLSSLCEWKVRIISVDPESRTAVVSWNTNAPETYGEHNLKQLKDWSMYGPDVDLVKGGMGRIISAKRKKKA